MDLFFGIAEKMIVFEGHKIIVTLVNGTEVEVVME
jgi:site-specific DNA recombinase